MEKYIGIITEIDRSEGYTNTYLYKIGNQNVFKDVHRLKCLLRGKLLDDFNDLMQSWNLDFSDVIEGIENSEIHLEEDSYYFEGADAEFSFQIVELCEEDR